MNTKDQEIASLRFAAENAHREIEELKQQRADADTDRLVKQKEIERLEGDYTRLRRMHEQMCDIAVKRFYEIGQLKNEVMNLQHIVSSMAGEYEMYGSAEDAVKRAEAAEQNQCLICETPADHDQRLCVTTMEKLRVEIVKLMGALNEKGYPFSLERENEQLQEEVKLHRLHKDQMDETVERLRADLDRCHRAWESVFGHDWKEMIDTALKGDE